MKTEKKKINLTVLSVFLVCGYVFVGQTIFLEAANGSYASNPIPFDGAVIPGDITIWLGDYYIWTKLIFVPGATAVEHTGYFSDDYSKVESRDPCAFLGPPPYPSGPWEYTLFAGNPQIPPADDTLVRGMTYYWCVDETDALGTTYPGEIWEFTIQDYYAFAPSPNDGQTSVSTTPILSWKAGFGADEHDIYFGTSFDDVNDSSYGPIFPIIQPPPWTQPVGDEDWDPIADGGLTIKFGTTYYWRVDQVNGRSPFSVGTYYKGDVWSFTTVIPVGETYHVDGVNGDNTNDGLTRETAFKTIQWGINAAGDYDTVLVWPGVYNEEIGFWGEAITVKSATDAAMVETNYGYAFSFFSAEGPDTVLSNFIIRNSQFGIYLINGASPTLSNLTIVNNDFGISAFNGSDPDISNCILWNNYYGDLFRDPVPLEAKYSWVQEEVNEPNIPLAGLISHFNFDEGAGTIAYDSAGTNDGTVNGATWTTGIIDGSLDFDGSNDYVSIPHDTTLNITGDITISTWIYLNEGGVVEAIVTKCVGNGARNNPYDFRTKRSVLTLVRADASGHEFVYSDVKIPLGEWHHGLVRVENKVPDFYVDGVITGKTASVIFTKTPTGNTKPVLIGRRDDGLHFNGLIDDVRIYDRALLPEEIETIYQASLAGHEYGSPLFADANNGDYHLLSERGRYWPAHDVWVLDDVTSPCIDGGDPDVSPFNERMPNGGRINMGAYGNTAYASMSEWPIKGDVDRNGRFNFVDVALLLDEWLAELPWVE